MSKIFDYFSEMEIDISWYKKKRNNFSEPTNTNLQTLNTIIKNCKKCKLHETRINTVFGDGSTNAKVMIIGEAPGKDEDISGKPFVGRAGKLLTEILSSINLERKDIFITNTVKCRPPENRNPHDDEIKSCSGYLDEQIKLINPKVIVLLGKIAANRILNIDEPISNLRGKKYFIKENSIPIIVFYHPAYLLRSPLQKSKVWEDLKFMDNIIANHDC